MNDTLLTAAIGTGLLLVLAICTSKALVSDGFGLDRAIAALWFRAKKGETVSLIVAQWQAAGRAAGCRWCAFLDVAVERGHCAKQFTDAPTPLFSGIRAGLWLLLLACVLYAGPLIVWTILIAIVRAIRGA